MKIIVKNNQGCVNRQTWLNAEYWNKSEAATALMTLFNEINRNNGAGCYSDDRESIIEMLEEEGNGELLEETVRQSLEEFGIVADVESRYYLVIVDSAKRYIIPESITADQEYDLAVRLIGSGDQVVIEEEE